MKSNGKGGKVYKVQGIMCYVFSENENESNQIVLLVLKCSSSSAFLVEKACHVMWWAEQCQNIRVHIRSSDRRNNAVVVL